jgi:hypothetical protein
MEYVIHYRDGKQTKKTELKWSQYGRNAPGSLHNTDNNITVNDTKKPEKVLRLPTVMCGDETKLGQMLST